MLDWCLCFVHGRGSAAVATCRQMCSAAGVCLRLTSLDPHHSWCRCWHWIPTRPSGRL